MVTIHPIGEARGGVQGCSLGSKLLHTSTSFGPLAEINRELFYSEVYVWSLPTGRLSDGHTTAGVGHDGGTMVLQESVRRGKKQHREHCQERHTSPRREARAWKELHSGFIQFSRLKQSC